MKSCHFWSPTSFICWLVCEPSSKGDVSADDNQHFLLQILTYQFLWKKPSECMQLQQIKLVFPYHLDFQQVWNFFIKYHQEKKTSASLWPDQMLEWNLKKTMENLPIVFLALTSASYQEQRTTLPVTQLLYNQFATCIFLPFKSSTTRIKGHLGNFSFHTVRVNTNNSVSTFLAPEMLVESRAAPRAKWRGVRSPQPVLSKPGFASSTAAHPKILHRKN